MDNLFFFVFGFYWTGFLSMCSMYLEACGFSFLDR